MLTLLFCGFVLVSLFCVVIRGLSIWRFLLAILLTGLIRFMDSDLTIRYFLTCLSITINNIVYTYNDVTYKTIIKYKQICPNNYTG